MAPRSNPPPNLAAQAVAQSTAHSAASPSAIQACSSGCLPRVCVLDAGCWLASGRKYSFGLVSGSHAVVCDLIPMYKSAGHPRHPPQASSVGNRSIDAVLDALHRDKPSTTAAPDVREWITSVRFEKALPWSDADMAQPDELYTTEKTLLVFVPDCHVGLRDKGDQFSPSRSTEALDLLLHVLTTIRASMPGAKVAQLGDFLEVWETEACPGIYFYDEVHSEYVQATYGGVSIPVSPFGPTVEVRHPQQVLRDRTSRSNVAIGEVEKQWHGTALSAVVSLFDLMILGNHDIERKWADVPFFGSRVLGGVERARMGKLGNVVVEHGHHLDKYNDTRKAISAETVMDVVDGKAVTYGYARGKRDWAKPNPSDLRDGGILSTGTEASMAIGGPAEFACEFLGQSSLVGQARQRYPLQALAEAFIANKGTWPTHETDPNSYAIPVRLWVHAHTHAADVRSYSVSPSTWTSLTSAAPVAVGPPTDMAIRSVPVVTAPAVAPVSSLLVGAKTRDWGAT